MRNKIILVNLKFFSKVIFIFCFLFLTSCSHLNSDFDCPMKPGIHCKSVDEINDIVDRGELEKEVCPKTSKSCAKSSNVSYVAFNTGTNVDFDKRSKEKTLQIFISSYVDKAGNLHDSNTIHTVIEPAFWITEKRYV